MEKRYQVFVSSTYEDLKDVRKLVIMELMGLRYFPVGMEFFPASDETQWEVIEKTIRDCDYYVVIIKGRYGSVDDRSGISYTEREYRYARKLGIPTLAFIHKDSDQLAKEHPNQSDEYCQKLSAFREYCMEKICEKWDDEAYLPPKVLSAILHQAERTEAVGWVRADQVPDEVTSGEVLRLTQQVSKLKDKLEKYESEPPPGADKLAQGSDIYTIQGQATIGTKVRGIMTSKATDMEIGLTWDQICAVISPTMLVPIYSGMVKEQLQEYILRRESHQLGVSRSSIQSFRIDDFSIDSILTQFKMLGIVENPELTGKNAPMWKLTPYGVRYMGTVKAIRRPTAPEG